MNKQKTVDSKVLAILRECPETRYDDMQLKAAVATQRMKQAYIATKEKAERSVNANSSSAEEYASDKLESGIDEVVHDGAYAFDKAGRKGLETTKENIRTAKDGIQRFKQLYSYHRGFSEYRP